MTASTMPASSSNCMLQASRLSPIEKRGNFWRSRTRTLCPRRASNAAETEPAGPAPMIKTSISLGFSRVLLRRAQRDEDDRISATDGQNERAAALGDLAQVL